MKAQVSQLVKALNVQQTNIVDSSQEQREIETKIEALLQEFRVEYQQHNQLEFDDVGVEVVLESTKDLTNIILIDSSWCQEEEVN